MKANRLMSTVQTFRELTEARRPQDPRGDGTGLRFETGEHTDIEIIPVRMSEDVHDMIKRVAPDMPLVPPHVNGVAS
jgi:urease beta subunit